ncbi:hypothetical protein, partial [Rhizobium ruizarguesonis]|uniref:hypothetical protein n=1 Tax=Rhizobium ruizarguesonis TaxID=2081791 RepID=UPI001952CC25
MVNDFLRELYNNIMVPHMVWTTVGISTNDKYWLSMVVDLESQISNVGRPYSADSPHFRWFGAYFALIRRIQPALRALPVRLQA